MKNITKNIHNHNKYFDFRWWLWKLKHKWFKIIHKKLFQNPEKYIPDRSFYCYKYKPIIKPQQEYCPFWTKVSFLSKKKKDLTNDNRQVRINSGGIYITKDGGSTWKVGASSGYCHLINKTIFTSKECNINNESGYENS